MLRQAAHLSYGHFHEQTGVSFHELSADVELYGHGLKICAVWTISLLLMGRLWLLRS